VFTFYEFMACSGYQLDWRWRSDSKAIQLVGDTRGFNYDHPKTVEFNFAYFPDSNVLIALKPVAAPELAR
jgi:hypothetical protein